MASQRITSQSTITHNMSDLSNIPKQSYFSAQLASPITAAQTSNIIATAVPDYTPSGETVYVGILDPQNPETMSVTGWNASTKIFSGVTRGVDTYTGESASGSAHGAGTTIVIGADWNVLAAIQTAVNSKFDTAGGTITGDVDFTADDPDVTLRLPNMTTTERNNIPTPANGMVIYNTTSGTFQFYDGGAWNDVGTATVNNASETVAGVVELSTNAEMGAGTSIGGTGARLVPPNDQLVKTSSGAGDENKIAVLNSDGQFAIGFLNSANTATANKLIQADSNGEIDDSFVGLTTEGDIMYRNSTNLTRLSLGAAGEKLVVNSGETAPEWILDKVLSTFRFTGGTGVTTETTVVTVAIPDSSLAGTGFLHVSGAWDATANGGGTATVTTRIKYGSTTVASESEDIGAGNTEQFSFDSKLYNDTGLTDQKAFTTWQDGNGNVIDLGSAAEDSTISRNLVITIQSTGESLASLDFRGIIEIRK